MNEEADELMSEGDSEWKARAFMSGFGVFANILLNRKNC
jgi:hypothetical protein